MDVVTLSTDHLPHPAARHIELARDLQIAIAEFAPGSGVIAAKTFWQSAALRVLPNRQLPEEPYATCDSCRRFYFRVQASVCGNCGAALRSPQRMVQPIFGFIAATPTGESRVGDSRPPRFYSSNTFFEGMDDSGRRSVLATAGGSANIEGRYSKRGWLAAVNAGKGQGFMLCHICGFAAPPALKTSRQKGHQNVVSGRACPGQLTRVHLGHRFQTDVVELSFPTAKITRSAAGGELWDAPYAAILAALLEGAVRSLETPRNDLDGTFYMDGDRPIFVLFDNVPGGAGLSKAVYSRAHEVVLAARSVTENCSCAQDSSCYSCLRNYRNQRYHDVLNRSLVTDSFQFVRPI